MAGRVVSAFSLLCACAGTACARPPDDRSDPRAEQVFERTKSTRAAYSAYSWNWARRDDGEKWGGWSAEFHRNSLHRVETPFLRVVADCATGAGTIFHVDEGRTEASSEIGNGVCGINSSSSITSFEWLDRRDSRFGPADRIGVADDQYDRTYAVSPSGILLASEYFARNSAGCVQTEAIAVEETIPADDIFSVESLHRSFVAERYRVAPGAPAGALWAGTRRCA